MRVHVFQGHWRLIAVEPEEPAGTRRSRDAMYFDANGNGTFQLKGIQAAMDCRFSGGGRVEPHVDFSWNGALQGKAISGRGWGVLDSGRLIGSIFVHFGPEFGFDAVRVRRRASAPRRNPKLRLM